MQDLKFDINKYVHWKKDFDHVSFIDRGEWKAKEGVFKERYWQFECADAYGKLVTLNANSAGINQFLEQLLNFNLPRYTHSAEFVMHQEIDLRKCLKGEVYKEFDDGKTEEERDKDCEYFSCGSDNLTGYDLRPLFSRKNVAVSQAFVKWYPQAQGRLMAFSLDPHSFQVTLHLNQAGYSDWFYLMELYRDRYSNFDLFKPRQRIIDKFGESRYYLTDCPVGCDEEQIVHFQVWKDCDIPKIINLLSYSCTLEGRKKALTDERADDIQVTSPSDNKIYFKAVGGPVLNPKDFARFVANGGCDLDNPTIYEGPQEERLFLQKSPRGHLELEAVILTCIERFHTCDYLDYQVTCFNSEYERKTIYDGHALCKSKRQRFTRVRFVFLRSDNLYLFSAEYDSQHDIVYFFISYAELFKWVDDLTCYEWKANKTISEQTFIEDHQDFNRFNLANIRYGYTNWYKFPTMSVLSCFNIGELFSRIPLSGSQCWSQPREYHDEYNVYRCPEHAFIIKLFTLTMHHAFMINPIATLSRPWWDQ